MVLKFEPWGDDPIFEWDEHNQEKIWIHGIRDFEAEECFENKHFVVPHPKAKSQPEKYRDRFIVRGITEGGRKLLVVVQHKAGTTVRVITAWEE
ncbi:MAG: hypothetical protein A3C35_00225 [Omnitrophica bacterium RIFCSPHIGHO2_02_FULL_46_11]|nr:MAG: hypothetical protein A3C35_00225 [Omnitrophica bacterium RIFCSPHIGHO2_02_FULL_46_11]OGW87585.1 MAG: hypothetical protein A3A81_03455 [Omnitrophica bacterium RIFCSPLOWO2_01_FULL_45_10b]